MEDRGDTDDDDGNPFNHFDDEFEEETWEAFPAYRKPCEKRNCTNPCCVKKNINHTHNTKDCNHTDKRPEDL